MAPGKVIEEDSYVPARTLLMYALFFPQQLIEHEQAFADFDNCKCAWGGELPDRIRAFYCISYADFA